MRCAGRVSVLAKNVRIAYYHLHAKVLIAFVLIIVSDNKHALSEAEGVMMRQR